MFYALDAIATIWTTGFLFFLGYGRASVDYRVTSHRQAIKQAILWPAYMIKVGVSYWRWEDRRD